MSCELKPGIAFVLTDLAPDLPPVTIASFGKRDVGYNHLENINEAKVREVSIPVFLRE